MNIFSATLSMVIAVAASKVVIGCEDCNSQCLGNLKWGGDYTGCAQEFSVSEHLSQTIMYEHVHFVLVPLSGDDNLPPRMYSVPTSKKDGYNFVQLCQANPNDEKMTCLSSGPDDNAVNAIYTATSWDEDCQVQNISVTAQYINQDKASNQLTIGSATEEYKLTSLLDKSFTCPGPVTKDNPI